ncbi:MAG: UDP-4-amino-4-deoxy-L-arabinose--oxoglutarate aminotransferase [Elusimicrobia bacterium]|nr:UDP-4-amino-4-deoxy-L-arabinose--oxoglutarate aminotransferase [Elusimicrobiota bacterium]
MIKFYVPTIDESDKRAVMDVLESKWLTSGHITEQFEEEFAKYVGAPYAVATNSCSNAMFLALQYQFAHNNSRWGQFSVPSFTCSATPHALMWAGVTPTFVDIDPETFGMLPTPYRSIPVHYAGKYNEQKQVLIEDSAHRLVPKSFTGNLTCYSFYVTKNITSGEGGMIACATKEQAEWLKAARLYGIQDGAWRRNVKKSWDFSVDFVGWKCNPIDLTMALGLSQLRKADIFFEERKRVAKRYDELLGVETDWEANHLYPILLNKRDEFIEEMKKKEIQVSVHFPPLHLQPAYKNISSPLPNTEWVWDHIVSLPIYPYMEDKDIVTVAGEVNQWRGKYGIAKKD